MNVTKIAPIKTDLANPYTRFGHKKNLDGLDNTKLNNFEYSHGRNAR
jgi:hypothetical protein